MYSAQQHFLLLRLMYRVSFAGEVFSLILDVVETNRAEDVKACLMFMDTLWDSWSTLRANFRVNPRTRLAFQKVYNMFCQRISNNQDVEVLGAVATVVAKLMPFNDQSGLNTPFNCNQHQIPMDESIGVCSSWEQCLVIILKSIACHGHHGLCA